MILWFWKSLPTGITGHGMTFPFPGQFPESGDPLPNELLFLEYERVKGRIANDQREYLTTCQMYT
jgi:hypothetical protein